MGRTVLMRAGAAVIAITVLSGAASVPALGVESAAHPGAILNLGHADSGWFPVGDDFLPPISGPGPVISDPAHPYFNNQSGRQPTDRVADLTNPILTPWALERMEKSNAATLAGKIPFSPRETCRPAGVPGFDVFSRLRPVYFLQTPKEVTIINEGDQQSRRVYLNVPHSKNPKPSWYGESVGHYEGDTLVIDTIGMNGKTYVDNYLTPHTTALHVVERFRLIEGGKMLEAMITVEDPEAFTMKWSARQRYRRQPQETMQEAVCAENNVDFFAQGYFPVPQADKPDF
ncbi:MAG TPA: hypothetical protein VGM72_12860 [Micropepsaceae bacterium]|jgi:hypothetical protein